MLCREGNLRSPFALSRVAASGLYAYSARVSQAFPGEGFNTNSRDGGDETCTCLSIKTTQR